jgi:hypothetical protein
MPYFLKLLYLLLPTQIVLHLNSDLYALTPPVSRRFQLLRMNPVATLACQGCCIGGSLEGLLDSPNLIGLD